MRDTSDDPPTGQFDSNSEVKNIEDEFSLPTSQAVKLYEYIGDSRRIHEELGKNASDDYLTLVLQREQLLAELDQRRDELNTQFLSPLGVWRRKQRYALGHKLSDTLPQDIHQEYNRRREVVKRYVYSEDEEIIGIKWELATIDRELCEIYYTHLEDTCVEDLKNKKDRIIELKRVFPYLRASNDLVATVVGTTQQYVQQIKYIPGEGVRDRQVPTQLRNRTLDRDNHSCVQCGATKKLEAHHIIPRDDGGEDTLENMAILCHSCHQDVEHGNLPYNSRKEFWEAWVGTEEPHQ